MTDTPAPAELLMIQDDPAEVVFVRDVLDATKVSNHLSVVHTGAQALMFLRREGRYADAPRPDLVLLDVNLPGGMDGRELLRHLRADPRTADLTVVLMVDSTVAEQIIRAEALPVQGYAVKPVDFDCLAAIVREQERLGFTVMRAG